MALERTPKVLSIGPSGIDWDGRTLRFRIDERCFPLPGRLQGEVRFTPGTGGAGLHELDTQGRHQWRPLAPQGRVDVEFDSPRRRWSGNAYFDCNRGSEPLEGAFRGWNWSRWQLADGVLLHYAVDRRDAEPLSLLLRMDRNGRVERLAPRPSQRLPGSGWRIARHAYADAGATPAVLRTLVDAPFYARSVVSTSFEGRRITGLHESLSLDRFASRWVQALLPFRMPRRAGAKPAPQPGGS